MLKRIWLTAGILSLIGLVSAFLIFSSMNKPYQWRGSLFQAASPSPKIQLSDTSHAQFQLGQEKGKIVLLYFGYTHCPDECPLTMAKLKVVKTILGAQGNKTAVVFVTIDPQRDTADVLRAFLAKFDPTFIGLTGSQSDLTAVWQAYGVDAQTNGSSVLAGYQVAHTTELYLIDQQGRLRLTYGLDNSASDIVQDVQYLLSRG